jgi:hypothetical protein
MPEPGYRIPMQWMKSCVMSESGFLSTRDDTESGDTSTASPEVARNRWKIGGRDQTAAALQAPRYCATAKCRMTRRYGGNEGLLNLYLV